MLQKLGTCSVLGEVGTPRDGWGVHVACLKLALLHSAREWLLAMAAGGKRSRRPAVALFRLCADLALPVRRAGVSHRYFGVQLNCLMSRGLYSRVNAQCSASQELRHPPRKVSFLALQREPSSRRTVFSAAVNLAHRLPCAGQVNPTQEDSG